MSTARAIGERPGRWTAQQRRNWFWGLVFTSPAIVGLLWFTAYPVLTSLYYSLTSKTMLGKQVRFIGLTNYQDLFTDSQWWSSLGNTAYILVISIPVGIIVALMLAILLNLNVKGQSFYRVIFYLPSIMPIVASSIVWLYLLNPQYGAVNNLLAAAHITGPGWMSDPNWSKPGLILLSLWGSGNLMVILLAGLQDVPADLYDAARVDGARRIARFWHVTLPFISPYLLFALVTGLIAGFQYFAPVYVMTGGSGTPAGSTLISSLYLYQNAFQYFKVGYASAMAWILFVIVAILALLTFRLVGRRVYYGGA